MIFAPVILVITSVLPIYTPPDYNIVQRNSTEQSLGLGLKLVVSLGAHLAGIEGVLPPCASSPT